MRKLTVLLILLVAVSFADVLFDQGYDGTCNGGWGSCGAQRSADDFVLTNLGRVESIEWWSFYNVPLGADYSLRIYDDNSGKPGTILWEVAAITPTDTDTGDDHSGDDLYHTVVTLDPTDYFLLEDGTTYWFSALWSTQWFYWACRSGGNMMATLDDGGSWINLGDEAMFRLNGTFTGATVEETTWGQIKAAHGLAD